MGCDLHDQVGVEGCADPFQQRDGGDDPACFQPGEGGGGPSMDLSAVAYRVMLPAAAPSGGDFAVSGSTDAQRLRVSLGGIGFLGGAPYSRCAANIGVPGVVRSITMYPMKWGNAAGGGGGEHRTILEHVQAHLDLGGCGLLPVPGAIGPELEAEVRRRWEAGAPVGLVSETVEDRPWRVREFSIRDPDNNQLRFGRPSG